MKRILIASVLLLVLVAAFLILRRNMNRTHGADPLLFRLENPAAIDKILLSPNNSKQSFIILYKEQDGRWVVKNDKRSAPADTHSIRELLWWAMQKVEMRNPVSDSEKEPITRDMALNGIKTVFYTGGKEVHTIYAGNPTPDQEATYMYHPDMDRPAVVQIAGFKGYLTPYFTVDFDAWRSPVLIDVGADQIATVKVDWPAQPTQGFSISKSGNDIRLTDASGKTISGVRDTRLLSFLERFQNISREYGELAGINRKPAQRDSILNSLPLFSLSVTDKSGKTSSIRLYKMAVSAESYAPVARDGTPLSHETETFWVRSNNDPELWVIQGAVIRSRMKTLAELTGNNEEPTRR